MIKRLIKLKLSLALHTWDRVADALRKLLRLRPVDRSVVLYYHGVTDARRERFRRQMQWLASHRRIVPIGELADAGVTGRSCCVTFDDALDSVRTNALPICREYGIPFSVYAVTGNLGDTPRWKMPRNHPDADRPIMTESQLRELPADLVTVGSHTVTHPALATLETKDIVQELTESKRRLEALLHRSINELSVPYGSFREDVLREARDAGYRFVLTCEPEVLARPHRALTVGRFKVTPDDWMIEFELAASGAYRWRGWLRRGHRTDPSSSETRVSLAKARTVEPTP